MTTHKLRIDYFDILKGIGIILVIIGHSRIPSIALHFIFSFHMPIFFLCSGYFFKEISFNEIVLKNFRRLIIPYIVTCILIILFSQSIEILKFFVRHSFNLSPLKYWVVASIFGSGTTLKNGPLLSSLPQIGAIWFLLALFWSLILFSLILKLKSKINVPIWISVIISMVIGYVSSLFIMLPFSVQPGMVAVFFIYIGYLAKKYNLIDKKLPIYLLIIMLVIWGICIIWGKNYMVRNFYNLYIINLLGGVCGTYFIVLFSKWISNNTDKVKSILLYFGSSTLAILAAHIIELNLIPFESLVYKYSSIFFLNFTIVITFKIVWALCFVWIVNKIPVLHKIYCPK